MQNSHQFMLEASVGDKRAKRILKKVPFVVPAKMRVLIFNKLLEVDKENFYEYRGWDGETRITIRRSHVFEDGFRAFSDMRGNVPPMILLCGQHCLTLSLNQKQKSI